VLGLTLAVPAMAQDPAPSAPSGPLEPLGPIDATKLGVSFDRIRKGLRQQETSETRSGSPLHLEFQVQVYGTAPRIDVIQDFDLLYGSVPGSAPSHQQMIDYWTPQMFSAPAMPISAMFGWVAQQLAKKSQKSACEEAIAQYRAAVMKGISMSAPRCAGQ